MHYFKYQNNQQMSKIWSLFRDLGETSDGVKNAYGMDYSHTLDIVKSALGGSISLSKEDIQSFNLQAYEYTCHENEKDGRRKKAAKLLNIVDVDSSDDDIRVGYGEVSSRSLASIEDSFDEVMSSNNFEDNIKALYGIRTKYIVEKGIDVVSVLSCSLKGIPEAVAELKTIMTDSVLGEIITSLCEDSRDGELLRRLEAVC